jgi:hypothetical protein
MKEQVEFIPKHKLVPDGVEEKRTYITDDGKIFKTVKEAKDHETAVKKAASFREKYRVTICNGYIAIYVSAINDEINQELYNHFYKKLQTGDLRVGWNLIEVDDSGDYTQVYCYSLAKKIESKKLELAEFEELMRNT